MSHSAIRERAEQTVKTDQNEFVIQNHRPISSTYIGTFERRGVKDPFLLQNGSHVRIALLHGILPSGKMAIEQT
jgi:hypothetical protein